MKKRIRLSVTIYTLFFCVLSLIGYGQPKAGHFKYDVISYEIIDTSEVSASDAAELFEWWKGKFSPEVYFNNSWIVVLQTKNGGISKSMYNRKSRILYAYYGKDVLTGVRIDSIQALKRNDKVLIAAIDTLKSDLQVIEYPKEKKRIHGYTCHKVTKGGIINSPALDEIWLAKFAHVPDLIFPNEIYFLIEGIPLEIRQEFEGIKFTWGVMEVNPVMEDDDIFNFDMNGYEVSFVDTPKLTYEGIHFIRTFEPKTD